jgi:hypothetical protein
MITKPGSKRLFAFILAIQILTGLQFANAETSVDLQGWEQELDEDPLFDDDGLV